MTVGFGVAALAAEPTPALPGSAPTTMFPLPAGAIPLPPVVAPPGPAPAKFLQPEPLPKGAVPGQLPPPNPLPFGDDKVRLPRLADVPGVLGATPVPTPADIAFFNRFIEGVVDPRNTLDLIQGRARLVLLKTTPTRTQIADESVASFRLLEPRGTQLTIIGRRVGTTVLNLWFVDPDNKDKEVVLSYLLRVLPDPEDRKRLEAIYQALEVEINKAFPNSRVRVTLVGDKLMLSGQAHDVYEATQILRIARANAPGRLPISSAAPTGNPQDVLRPADTPGIESFQTAGGPNVINNMRVPGEQQIMLKVVVAEVNRAAARSIGLNYTITNNNGQQVFAQLTGGLGQGGGAAQTGGGIVNLPVNLDNGQFPIAINALRSLNYARSLAEPNLTTMNGQTASFLAGGQFPVPIVGGFGAVGGVQGVQFVPFGVQLQFAPIITDRDRVRLTLTATVSTRDTTLGTSIGGAGVPGLTARTFNTTVELREGQTMAVAGLIQNNLGTNTDRVPLIGDLPLIGRVASFDRTSAAEQELVVLVTPELVHPLEPQEVPPVPGSDIFEPGDLEFYLYGRLESRRSYDYRSPVMNNIHRMLRYRRCEQLYILGPTGHADGPVVEAGK